MLRILLFICVLLLPCTVQLAVLAQSQNETPRAIVSDDFINARPQPKPRRKSAGHSRKSSRAYHLASTPLDRFGSGTLQVGVTLWKLQRGSGFDSRRAQPQWIATRVEADTRFRPGDSLRLSVESPRAGFLYVVDRDWFLDGSSGETNLIFPVRGDDNRLYAGRLIDIPAEGREPFTAKPQPNQAGEVLTIIVTSTPLPLPISTRPLRISPQQLLEWNGRWNTLAARFEMNDGAGQVRTVAEQQAASLTRMRQLTRDDPAPQTIYLVTPSGSDGFLFNVLLSYAQ